MKIQKYLTTILLIIVISVSAQQLPNKWDLSTCINYALQNNIQIQKSKINLEESIINTKQSKAQLLPSLSASIGQSLNSPVVNPSSNYTGSYNLSGSITLFDGGKILKNIEQQKLQDETAGNSIIESEKNIQMYILQIYVKILYATESEKVYQSTVKTSDYQYKRGVELAKAGSISNVDLSQLESQLSADKYQLVVAQNTLSTAKLELKQLLELNPGQDIDLQIPVLTDINVLKPISSLQSVYETSLKVMPQVKSGKTNIRVAELEIQKAKAGYLPKISLNASAGTNHMNGTLLSVSDQLSDNLNAGIGVSMSIPIFSNRENKSTVEKAKLAKKTVSLEMLDIEKGLLKEVEQVYQDALSAQSQYLAAMEKVKAMETSYSLIQQQYNLGMKNTLELLTEKNNLLAAQQNMMQSKYLSIMDIQILNLYQDLPLEIK